MACKQAAMSWIFNGAGSFEKLPVQEDGPRTCHSERSEESQNECAESKHIKIQDFSCLTTFHCNSIFALLLSFPKSLNFLLSPQTLQVSLSHKVDFGPYGRRSSIRNDKTTFCYRRVLQWTSQGASLKVMPCGARKAKRVNDSANIEWQNTLNFSINSYIELTLNYYNNTASIETQCSFLIKFAECLELRRFENYLIYKLWEKSVCLCCWCLL